MKKTSIIIAAACLAIAGTAFRAQAATIQLVASGTAIVGQPFSVNAVLDTKGDNVNAVQAVIYYPVSLFSLQTVNNGNSIINFWVTPPGAASSGAVQLAGIIPGGFTGSSGPLATFVFNPLSVGTSTFSVATATVLRNDGQGTEIPVTFSSLFVMTALPAAGAPPVPPINSLVTPDPFTPEIVQDPNIFGGKYFLVFGTTDKGSGIDHYEVLEGSTWHAAQSPYLLEDQSLSTDIYVRAVDHAGNFIVVEVPARHPHALPVSSSITLWFLRGIGLLCVVLLLIWFLTMRRKDS